MTAEEAIEWIVEQVLLKLEERKKKALVIFTGAAIGLDKVLPQLKQLLLEGWDLRILLSNSAAYVITPELIKKELNVSDVILESEAQGLKPLYDGISQMIIPTLTLNTAAKIAQGIADTLATNLIAHGIMEGIPTVAVKDACDLKNPIRLKMGMNKTPQPYLAKFEQHVNALESYGINMIDAENLYATVIGKPVVRVDQAPSITLKKTDSNLTVLNKKIISRVDIVEAKELGGVITVMKNSLVTPLAKDTARALNVEIRYEA